MKPDVEMFFTSPTDMHKKDSKKFYQVKQINIYLHNQRKTGPVTVDYCSKHRSRMSEDIHIYKLIRTRLKPKFKITKGVAIKFKKSTIPTNH